MSLIIHADHFLFFFFNDTATTEIYTLSLHDALPISTPRWSGSGWSSRRCSSTGPIRSTTSTTPTRPERRERSRPRSPTGRSAGRSEEHTSELQSRQYLVCRLLLEKKKTKTDNQ